MNLFRQLIQKQAGRNLQTPPSSDTIVVGCQSCKSHVPMHVMELSHSEPREILCRNCGHAVAFTRRSITHTHSRPSYRPSSGNLRTFVFRRSFGELVLNGRPVSVASVSEIFPIRLFFFFFFFLFRWISPGPPVLMTVRCLVFST